MARRDAAGWGLATLVVVVLAAAGLGLALLRDPRPDPAPPLASTSTTAPPDPAAAQAFLVAWERSRTGTWVVEADDRQERAGVVVAEGERRTAQRPPDRLVTRDGTVEGRVGGEVVGCAPGPDAVPVCRSGGPVTPYPDDVAAELRRLGTYVDGADPLYAVRAAEPGCFVLVLHRPSVSEPYGERARFCFDAATGAPVHQEVARGDVVDATVATVVRAPTDADFAVG